MPCYEYRCPECGQTLEIIKKFGEESESHELCPKCCLKMYKVISLGTFKLGEGSWFKNNYEK